MLVTKPVVCVVLVVACACGGGRREAARNQGPRPAPVRRDPWLAQVLQPPRPASKPFDVVVRVVAAQHCGGAMVNPDAPPPAMSPAANETALVAPGRYYEGGADVKKVKTDDDGYIQLDLPPGEYCVVLGRRGKRPPDNSCERAEWEECTGVVAVPVTEVMAVSQQTPCWDPCDPPASPPPSMMIHPESAREPAVEE